VIARGPAASAVPSPYREHVNLSCGSFAFDLLPSGRPRFQDTVDLQPEVVMQPFGRMLLDDEDRRPSHAPVAAPRGSSARRKFRFAPYMASESAARMGIFRFA